MFQVILVDLKDSWVEAINRYACSCLLHCFLKCYTKSTMYCYCYYIRPTGATLLHDLLLPRIAKGWCNRVGHHKIRVVLLIQWWYYKRHISICVFLVEINESFIYHLAATKTGGVLCMRRSRIRPTWIMSKDAEKAEGQDHPASPRSGSCSALWSTFCPELQSLAVRSPFESSYIMIRLAVSLLHCIIINFIYKFPENFLSSKEEDVLVCSIVHGIKVSHPPLFSYASEPISMVTRLILQGIPIFVLVPLDILA